MRYDDFLLRFRKAKTEDSLDKMEQRALDKHESDPLACMNIRTASEQRKNELLGLADETDISKFTEGLRQAEVSANTKMPASLTSQLEDIFLEYGGAAS